MKQHLKGRRNSAYYIEGILRGDRVVLAQAITIAESDLHSDQAIASEIMDAVVKKSGNSIRIGITGSPGVGKSTFIEAFGGFLASAENKVAVLTIDPSSQRTGGSILGDKTRMPELAVNPHAFIRPSSSRSSLGGVAAKTREAMLLCEAAGFKTILVETVGVGQSEVAVKNMTDFFLLLMLPGSGDELQGIKKGIMEMADLVVITKADGNNLASAKRSQAEFLHAINTLYTHLPGWTPKVLTCSSTNLIGLDEINKAVLDFVEQKKSSGEFSSGRSAQRVAHMYDAVNQILRDLILKMPQGQESISMLEKAVANSEISPTEAAKRMIAVLIDNASRK